MVPSAASESPHQLLGRLRFLNEATGCLSRAEPLPAALCYVPREVQYKICKDPSAPGLASASGRSLLSVCDNPAKAGVGSGSGGRKCPGRGTIELRKGSCIRASGEEYCNGHGLWVKLTRVSERASASPGEGQAPGRPVVEISQRRGILELLSGRDLIPSRASKAPCLLHV